MTGDANRPLEPVPKTSGLPPRPQIRAPDASPALKNRRPSSRDVSGFSSGPDDEIYNQMEADEAQRRSEPGDVESSSGYFQSTVNVSKEGEDDSRKIESHGDEKAHGDGSDQGLGSMIAKAWNEDKPHPKTLLGASVGPDEFWYPPEKSVDGNSDDFLGEEDEGEDDGGVGAPTKLGSTVDDNKGAATGTATPTAGDDETGVVKSHGGEYPWGSRPETVSGLRREAMRSLVESHFKGFVANLLQKADIKGGESDSWLEIVTRLSWEVAMYIKPDDVGAGMDPGNCVKIKCLASGKPQNSVLVKGIVCRQNVKNKKMNSRLENPKVLLLGGDLDLEERPVSNKFSSLDTIIQQEEDLIREKVAEMTRPRESGGRPEVVIVEKSVAGKAQEILLEMKITLVVNMKKTLLNRISKCLGTEIGKSSENLGALKLGRCKHFHVEKYVEELGSAGQAGKSVTKFLMFFEGCPKPLGCTVILMGANGDDLKKVKNIMRLTCFAAYHLALETSFLADEGAIIRENHPRSPRHLTQLSEDSNEDKSGFADQMFSGKSYEMISSEDGVYLAGMGNPDLESSVVPTACSTPKDGVGKSHDVTAEEVAEHLKAKMLKEWQSDNLGVEDSLSTDQHQTSNIVVQVSVRCKKKRTICEGPYFWRLSFYGHGDYPLGKYLRDTFFGKSSPCPICEESASEHVTFLTHYEGNMAISVHRNPKPEHCLPGEKDEKIWMWHRCVRCSSTQLPSQRVLMSDPTFRLSVGKFLELSFSAYEAKNTLAPCGHSLHRDCLRYYGFGSVVVCFQYEAIELHTVHLPPLKLQFNPKENGEEDEWHLGFKELNEHMQNSFGEIMKRLGEMRKQLAYQVGVDSTSVEALEKQFLEEKAELEEKLHMANSSTHSAGQPLVDMLELNLLRRHVLVSSIQWEMRLDKVRLGSGDEKKLSEVPSSRGVVRKIDDEEAGRNSTSGDPPSDGQRLLSDTGSGPSKSSSLEPTPDERQIVRQGSTDISPHAPAEVCNEDVSLDTEHAGEVGMVSLSGMDEPILSTGDLAETHDLILETDPLEESTDPSSSMEDSVTLLLASTADTIGGTDDSIPTGEQEAPGLTSHRVGPPNVKVDHTRALSEVGLGSSIGDELSADNHELDAFPDKVASRGQFEEVENSVDVPAVSEDSTQHMGLPFEGKEATPDAQLGATTPPMNGVYPKDLEGMTSGGSFKTFSRTSSSISLSRTSSNSSDIRESWPPLHLKEIISRAAESRADGDPRLLLEPGYDGVVVGVYDDEATSLIAYAVSSIEHQKFVTRGSAEVEKNRDREQENESPDNQFFEQANFPPARQPPKIGENGVSARAPASDQLIAASKKTINFSDGTSQGKVRFSVTCYFAKQFDALRARCMERKQYICSLSRCKKWGAQGGKSKVFFAKTADDRFVVKQVTRTELNSFLGFSPAYFDYVNNAFDRNPTCLAKIFGVYDVRVMKGGKETKMDLIVMENLLYGRKITRIYDLKGSQRSRFNSNTGADKVLLDMNLVQTLPESPIFVGNEAKSLLECAVWNDVCFLAVNFVMDYSLLVGVDEGKQELVVGIIDYMRQYTWDKHLETWVKGSGILGGPKNVEPTIVSPKQYQKRFRKAMSNYFTVVRVQVIPPRSIALPAG